MFARPALRDTKGRLTPQSSSARGEEPAALPPSSGGDAREVEPVMQTPTEHLADTLIERVDSLIQARNAPPEWGHPGLSVTPRSLVIEQLNQRIEALENAMREIALEVQKLSDQD